MKYRITTEGTGIVLADPGAEMRGERTGPEVPLSVDLTWQGVAPAFPYTMTTRFEQSAWVSGEVTIGDERIEVHCPGQRDHSWGVRDWWLFGWQWCSGRLDDGTWWHTARSIVPGVDIFQTGYLVRPDMSLEPVENVGADYELDDDMLPVRGALTVGDLEMTMDGGAARADAARVTGGQGVALPALHLQVRDGRRPRRARMARVQLPRGRPAPQGLSASVVVGAVRWLRRGAREVQDLGRLLGGRDVAADLVAQLDALRDQLGVLRGVARRRSPRGRGAGAAPRSSAAFAIGPSKRSPPITATDHGRSQPSSSSQYASSAASVGGRPNAAPPACPTLVR